MAILKLPSGLALWFGDDPKAYTVPARSEVADIQQTAVEVEAWLRTHQPSRIPSESQLARRRRADIDFWCYVDVKCWLDCFENQYSYLSTQMPKRQEREALSVVLEEAFARASPIVKLLWKKSN